MNDRPNLIQETMETAELMGGASWPSADATRWALEQLAKKIADRAAAMYDVRKGAMVLRDEILLSCGIGFDARS